MKHGIVNPLRSMPPKKEALRHGVIMTRRRAAARSPHYAMDRSAGTSQLTRRCGDDQQKARDDQHEAGKGYPGPVELQLRDGKATSQTPAKTIGRNPTSATILVVLCD